MPCGFILWYITCMFSLMAHVFWTGSNVLLEMKMECDFNDSMTQELGHAL
eukprot:m.1676824 g.1676824  ORF g.1676824 m.1676824 type:complete len:50 (-) comp192142_c0_seq1:76-225(-)